MHALGDHIQNLTREISERNARESEVVITGMLTRHYGDLPASAEEVFAMLERDGLCLEKRIPPFPQSAEYVLYRGPAPKIGEKLDESRVIDRAEAPTAFKVDPPFPAMIH